MGLRQAHPSRLTPWAIVAGLIAGAVASGSVAEAAFPGRNGRLAVSFGFVCGSGSEVATMRPSGRGLRILTQSECGDDGGWSTAEMPEWSPDGQRILFSHNLRPALMAGDGSGQANLPLAPGPDPWLEGLSFAPDGRHYAYLRGRPSNQGLRLSIWRAAIDGSEDRRLRAGGDMPRWSPGGRRIAYVAYSARVGYKAVWLMNARTGERIRRLAGPGMYPLDWSPDGREILLSKASGDGQDLVAVRSDGSGMRRLTFTPRTYEGDAAWSPDGRRIAFAMSRDRTRIEAVQHSLWTMTARGRQQRRIYNRTVDVEESRSMYVSWQPRRAELGAG